ncbi:hypothetical protein [Micromonospora endolithica]|uniref:Uncharacterized protein n=1 Tax=Micromonospora endolithica TaxID=230091 RepID=A0A3A9Z3D2_9ACTN|nr:hypothetical protein [Micromonospora endolithica]RKN42773.1 hypothetical protein D7223_22355 [Micromonospora endolithica]TWJ25375.1 hypothetical protein JD76_05545 [Micromonospora endolithica]
MGEGDAASMDVAERLTTRRRGLFRKVVTREAVGVGDRETVVRWLRGLHQEENQTVVIHRPWGSICVVADGRAPTDVMVTDGDRMWYAARPGSGLPQKLPQLSPDQVEHVMLDALTSDTPPRWPEWREF